MASALVTILFTDLVGSTELLARAGDEDAQRIFRAHHDLLASVAAEHGGEEVKWLGDGLMVAFPSALEALRAAVAMQHASRRPVAGERLAIRVGLNAGEALRDATDYFGTAVVVARRLCDRAAGGQILCTETVSGLVAGRHEFAFRELGKLPLKGLPQPVAACEVGYEADDARPRLAAHLPVVGREAELARLSAALVEAAAGRGEVVMVTGEAGIGKTRLMEELAERAEHQGMTVLAGRCFDTDWAPPYGAFVEAVGALVAASDHDELRADLGPGAAFLAQLVPAIRKTLPDLPEPALVQPGEERFRLLDAAAQLLVARSQRAPLLVCLEDLHWADQGTVAMLRHVARFAARNRLLVLGTYRDAEIVAGHPLADALGALPRETAYETLHLGGLSAAGVASLLSVLGEHDVEEKVGTAWARQTDGNPFFVKELAQHLIEDGKLFRDPDGRWTTERPLRELGVPATVRDVVARRLARLSEGARRLLAVASVFEGSFGFDVLGEVAGLSEDGALDALEEAIAALLVRAEPGEAIFGFVHNLIRQTVYNDQSPPRRVRLHRKVAEALETAAGGVPEGPEAGEIAVQYHHSRAVPGAERGVEHALAAADHAEGVAAYAQAADFLRMARDLLPEGVARQPLLLGRLGIALAWSLAFDEAVAAAGEAGEAIAATEDKDAAAAYLSDAAYGCALAGGQTQAWALARQGLAHAGARRDVAWARMVSFDHERRAAEDPVHPGIPLDTPERGESARLVREARLDPLGPGPMEAVFASRYEALTSSNLAVVVFWAGEYGASLPKLEAEARRALDQGQLVRATRCFVFIAECHLAQGRLDEGRRALEEAKALAARVGQPSFNVLHCQITLTVATGEGLEELAAILTPFANTRAPAVAFALGYMYANLARIAACGGEDQPALRYLSLLAPWLERGPAWTLAFPILASHAAEVLWVLERLDHVTLVEHALREKVIEPDFRYPMVDGRLALSRLCALQGRHEEATKWLFEARRVLDEQGAQPLLAIADYDEALMFSRRGASGDPERARPLLDSARRQFVALGMTGWTRRADDLGRRLGS
jgi:class 3 adenylate cyclase/tetratricopeptide (TPR) repeat protein/energy-coupling factor transporter ATP-binding protein EcfA2